MTTRKYSRSTPGVERQVNLRRCNVLSKTAFLLLASYFLFLFALPVSAAEGFAIKCTNAKCGYTEMLLIGPGMMGERITGYCSRCKKLVCISWKRDGESQRPAAVGKKGSLKTGVRLTYKCPDCGKPFTEIKEPEDARQCPRCHGKTTGWEQPMMTAD